MPLPANAPVTQLWTPYCGAAPEPAALAGRWNFDPGLLALLMIGGGLYLLHRRRGGEGRDHFVAAAGVVLLASFVSPLCALSSALFSARVTHHALLVAVAAPLLAVGLPRFRVRIGLAPATALHAVVLWTWHAPGPYAWALSHDAAYWLMQATLLGTALAFWAAVRRVGGTPAAAALLATFVQTGLLGALITFAAAPLYLPHIASSALYGLSPLEDQQLAGLIMWAPMAGAYLLAALVLVGRSLAPEPAQGRAA